MEEWDPEYRSCYARFTAPIPSFQLFADHPDVFEVGLVKYSRRKGVLEGFVRLHRRRSIHFFRKWVLPGRTELFRVGRSEARALLGRRQTNPWCTDVIRRMNDIRMKASR